MTFGEIKSVIEKNLFESYKDEKEFKQLIKEFKYYVLNNKKISRLYSLYDQLSTPQSLTEEEAVEFLNEGINLIEKNLKGLKLPITEGSVKNKYKDIDILVYSVKTDIKERIDAKKNIVSSLIGERKSYKSEVSLPLESMINVANTTIKNYISTLEEETKKEFLNIVSEDISMLEKEFISLRDNTLIKLDSLHKTETNTNLKNSIDETRNKINSEEFNYLNYFRLKKLNESLS